jgi:hypothetical protein
LVNLSQSNQDNLLILTGVKHETNTKSIPCSSSSFPNINHNVTELTRVSNISTSSNQEDAIKDKELLRAKPKDASSALPASSKRINYHPPFVDEKHIRYSYNTKEKQKVYTSTSTVSSSYSSVRSSITNITSVQTLKTTTQSTTSKMVNDDQVSKQVDLNSENQMKANQLIEKRDTKNDNLTISIENDEIIQILFRKLYFYQQKLE